MEKIINTILEYLLNEIDKMPTFYKIITLLFLLLFFLYLGNKDFRTFIQTKIILKIKLNNKFIELNELFVSEKYFLMQISNIDLYDNNKEKLFKIILETKIKSTIQLARDFLKENKAKFKTWTAQQFYQEIYILINLIIDDYEEKIKAQFIILFGNEKGQKLYNFVYTSAFKPYHFENVDLILNQTRKILYSKIKNENIKIYFVFTQFYIALESAISDCEKVFGKFNGDLTALLRS